MQNRIKWLVLSFPANFLFISILLKNICNYNNYNKICFKDVDENEISKNSKV